MFDLTKNIKLNPDLQKKYIASRIAMHVLFLVGALFVANRVLFPIVSLNFSFASISSLKNTLVSPRLNNNTFPNKGAIESNQNLTFNANPLGHFSSAQVNLTLDSKSKIKEGTQVFLQKSYQAFFYPLGEPVGFKTGSLLATPDGNHYIISNGLLRKFVNPGIISQFGYNEESFKQVFPSELQYNKIGPDIENSNTFPDDTTFLISDTYYQLKNQQLFPFISMRAFLSQYNEAQAILKNQDFLLNYKIGDSSIGFANGTLASSNQSVYILSNGKDYPIADANTFTAMGFDWKNVVSLEPEELGLYEQQKQFTVDQPHPDGIIFQDRDSQKYFIIDSGKKRPIMSINIAKTYAPENAVIANLSSLNKKVSCNLKKQFLSDTYSCSAELEQFKTELGNDYQILIPFSDEVELKSLTTTFSTPLTWQNLKDSLSNIKGNLKNNYSIQ